jgi:hypothetical protein
MLEKYINGPDSKINYVPLRTGANPTT